MQMYICQKKARVEILASDKINFATKAVTGDKEGHYMIIKWTIQQEDKVIVNIHASKGEHPNTQDN